MDTAVLLRYLESRATESEKRAVEAWLASGESQRAEFEALQSAWSMLEQVPGPDSDVDVLWERIRAGMSDAGRAADSRPSAATLDFPVHRVRRRGLRLLARGAIAAAAVLAVVRIGGWMEQRTGPGASGMVAYEAKAGEVNRVTLPDGSRLAIGGSSIVRVPRDYGQTSRDLHLDGEAYFEVGRDPERPFRVHTGRVTVENIGTRFTVVGFDDDEEQRVAVEEGMVAVAGADSSEPVVLGANDLATIPGSGPISVTRDATLAHYFSWLDGVAQFEQDELAVAARVIQRRFGVEVRVADPELAQRRFTGTVRAATLYADLRALALLLDAEYEREGAAVILGRRPTT